MPSPLRPLTLLALSLSLSALAQPPATPPLSRQQTLVLGQALRASISAGDLGDADPNGETYYDFYRFSAQAGQRVQLRVESSELDLGVSLERSGGGPGRSTSSSVGPRAEDESTKYRTASPGVIEVTLPAGGDWTVRVHNTDEGRLGAYTIGVWQRPGSYPTPALTPQVQPLALDREVRGELGGSDALDDYWRPYDVYRFKGREGQKVRVAYRGEGGISALLHRDGPEGQQVYMDENDFGLTQLDGANAVWFGHTLPSDGTYVIVVKASGGPDDMNPYRLLVSNRGGGAGSDASAEADSGEQPSSEFGDLGAFSFGVARGAFGDTSYLSFSGMFHMGMQLSPSVGVGVGGAVSAQDLEEETFYGVLVGPTLRWGEADGMSLTLMAGPSLYAGTLPDPDAASLGVGGRADVCVLNMDGFCLGGYVAGQKHGELDFNVQYGGSLGAQW